MRKIYQIHSFNGKQSWTIGSYSSKKVAEAWKKYFDEAHPHIEHTVLKEKLINFEPYT